MLASPLRLVPTPRICSLVPCDWYTYRPQQGVVTCTSEPRTSQWCSSVASMAAVCPVWHSWSLSVEHWSSTSHAICWSAATASISAVLPGSASRCTFAPHAVSRRRAPICPLRAACMSAVSPSALMWSTDAPASQSAISAPSRPIAAARISAVSPALVSKSAAAPLRTSEATACEKQPKNEHVLRERIGRSYLPTGHRRVLAKNESDARTKLGARTLKRTSRAFVFTGPPRYGTESGRSVREPSEYTRASCVRLVRNEIGPLNRALEKASPL
eukprot:1193691-Prorocentrum_minimum.AAC.5